MFFHFLNAVTSMQRVVVFSGAGVSAESGLKTFRGDDGLWEGHRVHDGNKCLRWLHSDGDRLYPTFVLLD
jgi:NAD-dependent SIR2 family protein deacetylase